MPLGKLNTKFFAQDARKLAIALLGKVIRRTVEGKERKARIIETESYYKSEKASHASLGYTEKRAALFAPAGTIYMYYARGGASFNISALEEGDAVLIKSAYAQELNHPDILAQMQKDNPLRGLNYRPPERLCSGQTLLCKSLRITVPEWDNKQFNKSFFIYDDGYTPEDILVTPRLGIPKGRDEELLLRFVDKRYLKYATKAGNNINRQQLSFWRL